MAKYVPLEWIEAKKIDFPLGEYARLVLEENVFMRKIAGESIDITFCKDCDSFRSGWCRRTRKRVLKYDFCSRGIEKCKST